MAPKPAGKSGRKSNRTAGDQDPALSFDLGIDEVQVIRLIGIDDPIRAERYQSDGEKSPTRPAGWITNRRPDPGRAVVPKTANGASQGVPEK
jgi:hypothetical protein